MSKIAFIISAFLIGYYMGFASMAHATVKYREVITSFDQESVPVLNEILRQILTTLDDHEARLDGGGL